MAKKAGGKVEKVMHEYAHGTLRSSSGAKVKSREQAVAIGLSEARAAGEDVAPKKKSSKKGSKKSPRKKAASKKRAKTSTRDQRASKRSKKKSRERA